MCGIAGIVAADRLHADERVRIEYMRDILTYRGPDGAGVYRDDQAALGHRRLSIVDLATGGQPLANEDQTIWIAYNGEIYNHASLRAELERAGHVYRTRSDTETIVHAYEQWGDDCVQRFRGMFAFAVWDVPRRRLLLARDRLGIKPLYWCLNRNRLVFASEIKAILESRLVEARPNTEAIPELLATRYLSGDETMFRGIVKLMPGHVLVFERGAARTRQYWDVPSAGAEPAVADAPTGETPTRSASPVPRFRELLEESVRLRLMSDVPLGMFLSGGIDSSAIAAIMARMIDRPLQTFSVAFRERAFSELEYARQVARAIRADAHEILIGAEDFFDALPRLVWHEDEPIAHTSSVPLYFVSTLARRHVTVVLTGEGSDELLAGYGKYPRSLWNWHLGGIYTRAMPSPLRRAVAQSLVPRLPSGLARYARRSFLAVEHAPAATFFDNFAAIGLTRQRALLAPDLAAQVSPERLYGRSLAYLLAPSRDGAWLQRLLYTDLKTYLVELLMKQDQMSMAASIESRVPFLDHVLVEFAATLPSRWKLAGWTTKRILREAVRDLLPPGILSRRKMGFPVPFSLWMRGAWNGMARDVLLDRRTLERGLFDRRAVADLLDGHAAGTLAGGDAIWSLLNLELWFRTFIDGAGVQHLPRPAGPRVPAASPEPWTSSLARPA
jgi:asparagine synthase (glutamine-hydrolysing)